MAVISKPITKLLRKQQRFVWTQACEEAFEEIKRRVSAPLALHRPDFDKPFFLQVDASTVGLGAVLFQKGENGNKQIVSYASTTLNKTEMKYHANELEVYGALFGIKKYQAFLADRKFTLITDSRSLYWLEKNKDTKAKLTRWALLLQEYDFETQHCPGRENELADFLSRNAQHNDDRSFLDESRLLPPEPENRTTTINLLSQPELYEYTKNQQRENHAIRNNILVWRDIQRFPPQDEQERRFFEQHVVENNTLYRLRNGKKLLVVPPTVVPMVISHFHETQEAAHPGIRETTRAIEQLYHHNNLYRKVTQYVNRCLICHSVKARQIQPRGAQRPHTATSPFEVISVDLLGPYPLTTNGNRFIFIVEDIFTKWVEAKAVPNAEADTLCQFLEDEVFSRYGYPKTIISDNGTVFNSNKYLRICERNHITPFYSAIHMQRQNPVERKIQDFKTTMRTLLLRTAAQNLRWDRYITQALRAQRTRRNRATGETPSMALLGYETALPGQWEISEFRNARRTDREERADRRQRIVARQLDFNQKTFPERDRPPEVTFRLGDRVMVKNYVDDPFATPWIGPFQIQEVLSNRFFIIDRNGKAARFHIDQIRRAPEENIVHVEQNDDIQTEEDDNDGEDEGRDAPGPADPGVDRGPPPSGQPLCCLSPAWSPESIKNENKMRQKARRVERAPEAPNPPRKVRIFRRSQPADEPTNTPEKSGIPGVTRVPEKSGTPGIVRNPRSHPIPGVIRKPRSHGIIPHRTKRTTPTSPQVRER